MGVRLIVEAVGSMFVRLKQRQLQIFQQVYGRSWVPSKWFPTPWHGTNNFCFMPPSLKSSLPLTTLRRTKWRAVCHRFVLWQRVLSMQHKEDRAFFSIEH